MSTTNPKPPGAETGQDQQRRRQMVGVSAANFVLVSGLLLLYAAIGSVPWMGPLAYVAVSLGGSAFFWWLIHSDRNLSLADPNMFAAQMGFAALVLFGAFAAMPQLAGAHLCNLFVTAIFGAVQFTPRQFRLAAGVASLSTAAALLPNLDRVALPGQRPLELLLLWAYVTLSLVRFGLIAGHVGALRGKLREKNLALAESLSRITHLAEHDTLTGALSRRCLIDRAEQAIAQLGPAPGRPLCLALLDLDHFKAVNDRHGHLVGDAVLQRFAALVGESLRSRDSLGRWGGEEFVLLLPDTDGSGAEQLLQRLHDAMAACDWGQLSPGLHVTTSAGIAVWQSGDTVDAMLQRADRALYGAKAAGRNRSELAPADLEPPLRAALM
jgi:diguanylate cyclase